MMWTWFKSIFKGTKTGGTTSSKELLALQNEHTAWWGNFEVEEEQSRFWKIAEHIICLDRYNHEWHIAHYTEESKEKRTFKTFASHSTHKTIRLTPSLPNKALICHLERPLYVPANEEIALYLSTPAWIRIEIGKQNIVLDEIPTRTLSNTWCGKNTLEGELCYAIQNHCATRLEDIPHGSTQILTPLTIINRSKECLTLQSLRLPLPYLSVFCDGLNYLWTEQLNIYYEGHDHSETLIKGPHKALKDLKLLTKPRMEAPSGASFKKLLLSFAHF